MRYFRENPELTEIDPRDLQRIEARILVEQQKQRDDVRSGVDAVEHGAPVATSRITERQLAFPNGR